MAKATPWTRNWIPSPATAAVLVTLAGLAALLRAAVVSPKALAKARDRWETAHASGGTVQFRWEDAAVLGTHYSTLILWGLLALALVTLKWWYLPAGPKTPVVPQGTTSSVPPARAPSRRDPLPAAPRKKWFLPALAGLVVLAAGLRIPLAHGSLWWDELWNVKYATVGEWKQADGKEDTPEFVESSFKRAAWYYAKPTNHPVTTLPSRAAHLIWRAVVQPEDPGAFKEWVIRLPVLLAGLAALVLAAELVRRLAGEGAGLLVAALAAVHPWLIRYGVDARSYGPGAFFLTLAVFSLVQARSAPSAPGNDRWWWIFGLSQFGLMWSHALAHIALSALLFLTAFWLIHLQGGPDKWQRWRMLTVVNVLAAGLLLVVFLPNLLQASAWGPLNADGNLLNGTYFLRTLGQIAAGQEVLFIDPAVGIPTLPGWALTLLVLGGSAAAIAGFAFLFRKQFPAAVVLWSLLVATGLFLTVVRLTDFYFYHRFLFALGMPVLIVVAVGLSRLRPRWLGGLVVIVYTALCWPQIHLLQTRSYAPFRESVASLKQHAGKPDLLPVGYGLGSHVMQCYCPEMRDIRNDPATRLQTLISEAEATGRPLLVAVGYEALNRRNLPEGFALLDNPALFESVDVLHGIDPDFTFRILKFKPGTAPPTPDSNPGSRP